MHIAITMTLIICGTVIILALMGLLFAAWVIQKGAEYARNDKK
ncbi:MAG: hypothetical protein WC901_03410 [Candidatus Margulisiibacteriota bacterium]